MEAVRAHLADAADQLRRETGPGQMLADVTSDPVICVLACSSDDDPDRRAASLARAAERYLDEDSGWGILVGCSEEVAEKVSLPRAAEQAREAIRIALGTGERGPVVRWDRLGAYRMVSGLLGPRDPSRLLPSSFMRLLAAPDAATLTVTLERYLDLGGDARAAADDLFVHRSSLYGRLHKIEEVAGVDLHSGEDRLELHLALRLWRLSGSALPGRAEGVEREAPPRS